MIARQRGEHAVERRRFSRPVDRTAERDRVIAVVGGGASGTLAAVHLLRAGHVRVMLIDPGRHGLGVAYSTNDERHLLNVRAAAMGGLADEPEDFLRWCRGRGLGAEPDDYLPRRLYGAYLQDLLTRFGERTRLRFICARVQNVLEPPNHSGVRMTLSDGRVLSADAVVLALGNPSPATLEQVSPSCHAAFIRDPWAPEAIHRASGALRVAILGSGLTAVDVALSVLDSNPAAEVSAISRHGWLPRAHLPGPAPAPNALALHGGCSLERILQTVTAATAAAPGQWRTVLDGLRPITTELWQGLTAAERERFERELRPYWDAHRHRVAPAIGARLASQIQDGHIEIHAGRITAYAEDIDGVEVTYRDRESRQLERLRVDGVINCTGPESDCRNVDDPLLTNLIRQKLARPDSLFLGLEVSPEGALIDAHGAASNLLYAIGPVRKGSLWETIAVPELRVQVSELSRLFVAVSKEEDAKREEHCAAVVGLLEHV